MVLSSTWGPAEDLRSAFALQVLDGTKCYQDAWLIGMDSMGDCFCQGPETGEGYIRQMSMR
jgi:hypothetical protein